MVYIQPMNRSSCGGQANSQDRFDTFMTSLFQLQEISLEIISVKIPFFLHPGTAHRLFYRLGLSRGVQDLEEGGL